MKKLLLIFIAAFTCFSFEARAQINDSANHGLMLLTTKENENMKSIQGSPYMDEDFQYGMALIEGRQPLEVFLRYDVFRENMEIKTDKNSSDVYTLPYESQAVYRIGGDKIIYDEISYEGKRVAGYFIEHYNGDSMRLLEKPSITITEAIKARTGYEKDQPARMKIEEDYYIITEDGEVKNVRTKHRDVKKAFTSKVARQYLSNNKIRSEQDLASFVAYLDDKK